MHFAIIWTQKCPLLKVFMKELFVITILFYTKYGWFIQLGDFFFITA